MKLLSPEIAQIVIKKATDYKIEPCLVAAVTFTESSGISNVSKIEPGWKYFTTISGVPCKENEVRGEDPNDEIAAAREVSDQRTSWGLMQVMGAVARQYGYRGDLRDLFIPETGLDYGCRHLKNFLKRYDIIDSISAYNAGGGGICSNPEYVSKVVGYLCQFRRGGIA